MSTLFIHLAFILENSISINILYLQISFGFICTIIKRQTFHFIYVLFIKKQNPYRGDRKKHKKYD